MLVLEDLGRPRLQTKNADLAINKRCACRICGGHKLNKFLEFIDIPLVEDYLLVESLGTEFLYPLKIYVCEDCQLVQTQDDIDTSKYYRNYHYSTASSPFIQRFMRRVAQDLFKYYDLKAGDSVVEIGSGDGSQLLAFKDLGANVLGFEPSIDLSTKSLTYGIPTIQEPFTLNSTKLISRDLLPVKLVFLSYTFDHLEDPLMFLKSIREVLDPIYGLLVIEVHDLSKIIKRREYCLFEHEHPSYWSIDTIRFVMQQAGFKLLNINIVPENLCRANSLLIVSSLESSIYPIDISSKAESAQLRIPNIYNIFSIEVKKSLKRFYEFIQTERSLGYSLAGFGAGGRGIMTLAMNDIKNIDIVYCCDTNPSIFGYYSPKSHLPLVSSQYLINNWVDEVIVFSFGYIDDINIILSDYIKRGGKVISLLELL